MAACSRSTNDAQKDEKHVLQNRGSGCGSVQDASSVVMTSNELASKSEGSWKVYGSYSGNKENVEGRR